jgi:segregation and condensation protein B
MEQLEKKLEAVLFWKGEPVSYTDITKNLNINLEKINSLIALSKDSADAFSIVSSKNEIQLTLNSELSDMASEWQKKELEGPLSKAVLETLAVIAYKGPISKSEIEYIRGVNSQFSLRQLLIRGLIEKEADSGDARKFMYSLSVDALKTLGVTSKEQLPEYQAVHDDIEKFKNEFQPTE